SARIPPPTTIINPQDFSLSRMNVFGVVLLKPYFSSITKVLYQEKGKLRRSLANMIIPKKTRPITMLLSEMLLARESTQANPSKKRKASIIRREKAEDMTPNLYRSFL